MIIDTHAHIYNTQFENEYDELIRRSFESGVEKILMPNVDLDSLSGMLELSKKHPTICYPMLGLHPCDVFDNYKEVLETLYPYFEQHQFIGVGEIGLDLFHDKTFVNQQIEAFHIQINWALEKNLPIAIHSRNANDEAIKVVSQYKENGLQGVFHCFSGTLEQAQQMIDLGFYLGIGGVATFKNGGLAPIIKEIGLSKIVLETDSPYLAPVPFRGKRNEPSFLTYVTKQLSDITQLSMKEIENTTTTNAKHLFKI